MLEEKKSPLSFNLMITLAVLGLGYFLSNFQRLALAVLGQELIADFSLTESQYALLGAAIFYPYAILQIPSGYVGDRVPARRLIMFSCLVSGIGALLFALSSSYYGLVAGRLITSAGTAFVYVPALAVLRREFGDKNYGTWAGFFMATGQLGSISAAAPLRFISGYLSRSTIFIIIGVLTLAAGAGARIFLSDGQKSGAARPKPKIDPKDFCSLGFLSLIIWFMCAIGINMAFLSLWGGRFYTQSLALTPGEGSICLMMISVGSLIGSLFLGRVADKCGVLRTLIICGVIRGLGWAALGYMPEGSGVIMPAIVSLTAGIFLTGASTAGFAAVKLFVAPENTGLATGVINCGIFVGSGLFTQLSGPLMGMTSGTPNDQFRFLLTVFAALICGACGLVTAVNYRRISE